MRGRKPAADPRVHIPDQDHNSVLNVAASRMLDCGDTKRDLFVWLAVDSRGRIVMCPIYSPFGKTGLRKVLGVVRAMPHGTANRALSLGGVRKVKGALRYGKGSYPVALDRKTGFLVVDTGAYPEMSEWEQRRGKRNVPAVQIQRQLPE